MAAKGSPNMSAYSPTSRPHCRRGTAPGALIIHYESSKQQATPRKENNSQVWVRYIQDLRVWGENRQNFEKYPELLEEDLNKELSVEAQDCGSVWEKVNSFNNLAPFQRVTNLERLPDGPNKGLNVASQ